MNDNRQHQFLQLPVKDWPCRNNSGRDAFFAILIPFVFCSIVKWRYDESESLLINYGVMLVYLAGLLAGLLLNLVLKRELNAALGLAKDFPDLDSYAQAANNIGSIEGSRRFLAYARSVWWFELVFGLGFVASSFFNIFFQ